MTAAEVETALKRIATPEKAKASAWFFKTKPGEYGAGDRFLGVTEPEQRKVAKKFKLLPLSEVEKLLKSSTHEHRLTALFILVGQYQAGDEGERQAIVDVYLKHLDRVNNWDLVDSSASYILGSWLLDRGVSSSSRTKSDIKDPVQQVKLPRSVSRDQSTGSLIRSSPDGHRGFPVEDDRQQAILPSFAKSENIWHRRIAMITCQAFIRNGEFDDAIAIADILVHDSHDLIQKAVGWMLREIGDRDRAVEERFLKQHAATMPRTMLRYATEKFPELLRKQYLALKPQSSR